MTTTCEHGQQFYCIECKNAGKPTPGEVGRTDKCARCGRKSTRDVCDDCWSEVGPRIRQKLFAEIEAAEAAENTDSLTTMKDMFIEVTGQLADIQQTVDTLCARWRKKYVGQEAFIAEKCADELEFGVHGKLEEPPRSGDGSQHKGSASSNASP